MRRFVLLCEELESRSGEADRVAALARYLREVGRAVGAVASEWVLHLAEGPYAETLEPLVNRAFSFFLWLGGPSLQWGWSSELFPTRLRGRSQGFCNGMCRLAISINIFLVPVALASIGFGPFIALLSLPLFAYALIVNRI